LWEITVKKFPAERQCLCGATNLKMAERHWMMIQRNREAVWATRVLMKIASLSEVWYRKIEEAKLVKRIAKTCCVIAHIPCNGTDCLCGLVVRVTDCRSRSPASIPGTTRFSEK
jgi:hypothetical protein